MKIVMSDTPFTWWNCYLSVALILGTSVPKVSKMAITAEMNVIAQK